MSSPCWTPCSSPKVKKRKVVTQHLCIVRSGGCAEKQKFPSAEQWKNFKDVAHEWARVRGKYSTVSSNVKWEDGPEGNFWHKDCKWKRTNKRSLEQASRAFHKSFHSRSSVDSSSSEEQIVPRVSTRLSTGPINDSYFCIWCAKTFDGKHTTRDDCKLSQVSTWYKLKTSVPYVKDDDLRVKLTVLVDSITDPLTAPIW